MKVVQTVQIRSFVKGGNHGQYLQASGLRDLTQEILPATRISHLGRNNHFAREMKIQTRAGLLPKYLSMLATWHREFNFSKLGGTHELTVYGSDQIWHCGSELFDPDPIYFGANDHARKIAYAPSVANRDSEEPAWISKHLKAFDWIGARDANTAKFVYEHLGYEPDLVIDPCFFVARDVPRFDPKRHRGSTLSIYSPIGGTLSKLVLGKSKQRTLPRFDQHILVGYFPRTQSMLRVHRQVRHPFSILSDIANSSLLVTSTFHGVMMALMTGTPFVAVIDESVRARLDSPILSCFSRNRLVRVSEFESLNESRLYDFCNRDDLNIQALEEYKNVSKYLYHTALNL